MNVRRLAAVLVGSVLALGAVSCTRAPKQRTVVVFNLLSHPILDASVRGIKTGLFEHPERDLGRYILVLD